MTDGPWAKYQEAPAAGAAEGPWSTYREPGVVDKIVGAGKAVVDTVRGQNEFDYPEIDQGLLDESISSPFDQRQEIAARLYQARGEDAMVDVLRRYDPDLVRGKDKYGNQIVNFRGKPYYLNKSGLSQRDLSETARDVTITAPFSGAATAVTRGAPVLVRAIAQGAAGGAGSLTIDAASSAAGSRQGVDVPALVASVLGGGAGEMLGSAAASIVNVIRTKPDKYVDAAGALTDEGRRIFAAAGFDADEVSTNVANAFAARARKTGPTEATAREAAAGEFGIPLTRGQATGDFGTIAFEQAAKANARGEMAGDIMRGRFNRQYEAVDAAKGNMARELGPTATGDVQDAAGTVLTGVRNREEAHGQMVDAAWDQARKGAKGVTIPKAEIRKLPDVAREALRADPRLFTPDDSETLYPAAVSAMRLLQRWGDLDIGEMTTKSGQAVSPLGVGLEVADELRKMLSGKGGLLDDAKSPGDRLRVKAIANAVGDWLDDMADQQLMRGQHSKEALEQFKSARKASAKHFQLFGESAGRGADDAAGRTIERMIKADVTEQEVANWIWGKSRVGESGDAYRVIKRLGEITGRNSEEWDAIRRGMWLKVVTNAEGKTQPGAQQTAQDIFEFVNGKGRAIAQELYSRDEIAKMRRFAATLKNMVPPADATNPSKSGYEVARALGDVFNVNAPFYIRIFGLAANANNARKAIGGGAPKTRTSVPSTVPAASSVGADRYLNDQD